MNPLIKKQTDQIIELLHCLHDAFRERDEDLRKARDDKERLVQENWRQKKNLAVLQQLSADYDDLQHDYSALQSRQQQLRQRLRKLLTHIRALSAGLRQ